MFVIVRKRRVYKTQKLASWLQYVPNQAEAEYKESINISCRLRCWLAQALDLENNRHASPLHLHSGHA